MATLIIKNKFKIVILLVALVFVAFFYYDSAHSFRVIKVYPNPSSYKYEYYDYLYIYMSESLDIEHINKLSGDEGIVSIDTLSSSEFSFSVINLNDDSVSELEEREGYRDVFTKDLPKKAKSVFIIKFLKRLDSDTEVVFSNLKPLGGGDTLPTKSVSVRLSDSEPDFTNMSDIESQIYMTENVQSDIHDGDHEYENSSVGDIESAKNPGILKILPLTSHSGRFHIYSNGYSFSDNQILLKIVIEPTFLEDPNYEQELRKSRIAALDWIKQEGFNDKDYLILFTEGALIDEFQDFGFGGAKLNID